MEAKTLRQNEKGEILLDGGDNGVIELSGTIDASGMEAGQSAGSIKAIGAETHVKDGATLHATGAVDGGLIETSGDYLEIGDTVDIDAAGKTGEAGEWLLDPLEVIIAASKPSGSEAVTNGNTDGSYTSSNTASGTASRNKITWVNSATVNNLLNKGTAVSVQATDANKVASITVNSAINKTQVKDTSLTLEAQRNVTVNAGIASSSGALNVNLHSDTDGDGLGAVLINADIATNGGAFTSGSGTTIESGSVGTYFGNQGETGNRNVKTNGGAISLYGDVAIGLNGGTLTLDMRKGDSASGAVTVTGTVDSGNSYKRVSSGLEGWEDFVKSYYDDVISKDKSSRYRYTRYGRVPSYDELSPLRKSDLSSYLAVQSKTWAGAKAMAQGATKGTNNTGDTYLATITTALENSLASPAEEYQLIVGGRGSGKATTKNPNPADPEHPDGYYWVTGPEGMANDGKGTKFANNDGSAANNFYVKWNNSYSQDTGNTEKEPNNSGPIVSIGFGTASNWDDVSETAGTIRGFVQEKNLAHSGLIIHAGDSKVDIAGNLGNSVALKNVEINAGDVAIGSGSHYTGIVHSDEGVSITGKNVTVGDRITADTKGVDIQATGDIHVDGITSHENINLTTTNGSIVLDKEHNDGSLHTASQDNDAVVIDVQGAGGSFRNLTSADVPAITTGEGGNWKVYSYSPDADKFGTNLNSGTNAQWGATSTSYSASQNDGNKYIFQVQPTVYVTANDMTKVYGEELTNDDVTTTAEATFTGQDNKEHNVNEYTNAFNEGDVADYYNGSGTFTSEGWAKTATRTGGDKAPASEPDNKAIYNIKAASDSYNLTDKGNASGYKDATTKNGGTVEILRRQINVNGSGNQTYGNATINDWTLTATLTGNQEGVPSDADAIVNDDKLDESTDNLSIKSGSLYADNKGTRTTANANENPYEDAVNMENVGFVGDAGVNYKIVNTKGDLTVNKANLTIHTDGFTATYGDVDAVKAGLKNAGTLTGLTNGDENDFASIVNGTSAALSEDGNHTNHAGSYVINAEVDKDLQSVLDMNYKVENKLEDAVITPYTIKEKEVINPDGSPLYTTKYGQKDPFGKATFTGVNGDGTYELTITDSSALKVTGEGKVTQDVGKNIYDTTVELSEAMNGNYQFAGGVTSKTFENTASVTPAELTIETKGVETEYGTVKETTSEVKGLVNGDLPTGFLFDYGDYGGAYLDGNTKTNDVNTYHFGTDLSGADFLNNYTITGGEADVKIDPKDVTFFVSGTGNTLADVTYTVDPDIDAQLAYGEHVDAAYTPGNALGDNRYGVVAHINGTPIVTGDVAGNYRYNYGGLITLSPTVPTKPDIDPHNPSNLDGSGSWTSNMGNHGVPGVECVAGLASAELPFFKVEAGQVSHYGTYDVAADPDRVRLEPTGKRLPEPNQPKTQYREYTKALTTTDGTGMLSMVYDGSVFRITPVDDAALALVRTGDVKNNVELSAEALHAGFSEMGILLEDLDGVYVHFENLH